MRLTLSPPSPCAQADASTQWLDCGIPCPAPFEMTDSELSTSFGIPIICFVVLCTIMGLIALKFVGGNYKNCPPNHAPNPRTMRPVPPPLLSSPHVLWPHAGTDFVAGRSLSLPVVAATLAGQGIDGSGTMGNIDLAYNYHFWVRRFSRAGPPTAPAPHRRPSPG